MSIIALGLSSHIFALTSIHLWRETKKGKLSWRNDRNPRNTNRERVTCFTVNNNRDEAGREEGLASFAK